MKKSYTMAIKLNHSIWTLSNRQTDKGDTYLQKKWLYRSNTMLSNLLSESLFLLGVKTIPPWLKSLSTGALDGVGVFSSLEIDWIRGNSVRDSMSALGDLRYSMTSASTLYEACGSSSNMKKSWLEWPDVFSGVVCWSSGIRAWHLETSNLLAASLLASSFSQRTLNFGKVTAAMRASLLTKVAENRCLIACNIRQRKHETHMRQTQDTQLQIWDMN